MSKKIAESQYQGKKIERIEWHPGQGERGYNAICDDGSIERFDSDMVDAMFANGELVLTQEVSFQDRHHITPKVWTVQTPKPHDLQHFIDHQKGLKKAAEYNAKRAEENGRPHYYEDSMIEMTTELIATAEATLAAMNTPKRPVFDKEVGLYVNQLTAYMKAMKASRDMMEYLWALAQKYAVQSYFNNPVIVKTAQGFEIGLQWVSDGHWQQFSRRASTLLQKDFPHVRVYQTASVPDNFGERQRAKLEIKEVRA